MAKQPAPKNSTATGANLVAAAPSVMSLDGAWRLAIDPQNVGRQQQWQMAPVPAAKTASVPWVMQDTFPGYHGVAWYWRDFVAPRNPFTQGRFVLRCWAVDYLADVWLNGIPVGHHEGGETPFTLDVTAALKPGAHNRLAVRVLNPTLEPIDGLTLDQTPHQARVQPYWAGAAYNAGGITDSVELLTVPAVWLEDLWARPDAKTGVLHIQANAYNASLKAMRRRLEFAVAPAASGETVATVRLERALPPGDTLIQADLKIENPHLWNLNDPYLYRVTARVEAVNFDTAAERALHERSVRCGFRDFRFERGYFRLNDRRLLLRCTHTCNHFPIGLRLPHDPDLARRDLLDVKAMGFNAIRFIWGGTTRYQLDLCDEIGLMVYEESFASSPMADSPQRDARFDHSITELIRRDRNHPSIVIWGLLNEVKDGPYFRHAAATLPLLRSLDDNRMVFLNSGRWDLENGGGVFEKLDIWHTPEGREPWITRNPLDVALDSTFGFAWAPHQVALHPGPTGTYSVARWTAPAGGVYAVRATFTGLAQPPATTDVHVLRNGKPLFAARLNLNGSPNMASHADSLNLAPGDTLDFAVGWGNGNYGSDTTALAVTITAGTGQRFDLAADFSPEQNPRQTWSYGIFAPGEQPQSSTFTPYSAGGARRAARLGSLSNPGSTHWEDVLADQHFYPRVPHTGDTIQALRTDDGAGKPLFLSEYGIGSAVDLWRVTRHYEQLGKTAGEDAQFYQDKLNRYLNDWQRWHLEEVFERPAAFFEQSLAKMAGQRALGLNAIRANLHLVAHSVTGMNDHVSCGEGLTTTFRELKPGTVDALYDAWAPLRLCLFVDRSNIYNGTTVRLEAVLANEDALAPGAYPVRLQVIGPHLTRVLDHTVEITVPPRDTGQELPFALPFFKADVAVHGPVGKYRFLAAFEHGAAATGGTAEFYLDDAAQMPAVETSITLWGEDAALTDWLKTHGILVRPFTSTAPTQHEVILVSRTPPAPGDAAVWHELAQRIAGGATAVFLAPEVFAKGNEPLGWLPWQNRGTFTSIQGWLYLKDEWAKQHPIFDGLPAGGLMDYTFYREIIPDTLLVGPDAPDEAVAGAIKASQDYASGLMVAVYHFGAGRLVLNTLRIRDNLGQHPAAERLLRNMLRYAACDAH